jgi:type IV fimbrial biogenesis protein FimT
MNATSHPVHPQRHSAVRRCLGSSLIEALCACSVAATVVGAGLGGMGELMQSQRLQAAASELETEIQLARSSALVRGQTVHLTVQSSALGTCKLIHTGIKGDCNCSGDVLPVCAADAEVVHRSWHDAATGVRYTSKDTSLAFSASRGTVTPTATLKLTDNAGRSLHQVVNVMGRTRTCRATDPLPGYKPC